jgi:CubicO group peptidase (beta-lactamase class C family)
MRDAAIEAELLQAIRPVMKAWGIPGLAIALVAPGRQALVMEGRHVETAPLDGHSGVRSHDRDAEASPESINENAWFSVASLGKHLTAWAVLRMAEQGLIDLKRPVGGYLTGLPPHWAAPTVEQLLHHTSGLPEYLTPETVGCVPSSRGEFIAAYRNLPTAFSPGRSWIYTNTNYILLGLLVAELAGQSYGDYLHQALAASGVEGVAVASPDWVVATNAAAHRPGTGVAVNNVDVDSRQRAVIGDGDIAFTPRGALQWLLALTEGRLLGPAMQETFFQPSTLASGRLSCYAAGWFTEPLNGQWFVHHAGHFRGWTAMGIVHPKARAGVIAMCNHAPGHTRFIRYLAQMVLERFAPGTTPLSLGLLKPPDPAFEHRFRSQFLRAPGQETDPSHFAEELRLVAEHGSRVRNVPNLWSAHEAAAVSLVEDIPLQGSRFRRVRLSYGSRVEHFLVGTTPEERIHWAWGL